MTPSLRFVALLFAASVGPVAVTVMGIPLVVGMIPTAVLLTVALADRLTGTRTLMEITRNVGSVLSVGTENSVTLSVRNLSARKLFAEIVDEPPVDGAVSPSRALRVFLPPWKTVRTEYRFTPGRRGKFSFDGVWVRHSSLLGLWRIVRRFELADEIQVFPNIEALRSFELLARQNSLAELGIRATRMKGDGTEFERMREYRQGDDPRHIDWKTTARLSRLIVREMGQERNQNIMFMIDMGRMMRQTTGGLSHFDYALNTAIILGHIAQQKGDNVGALLFSDTVKRFVPLSRGRGAVEALVHAAYDMEPQQVATNYRRAFKQVMSRVRRRSLILLMTHLVPGEDQRLIRAYSQNLGQRHLPLCLFFKEPSLEEEVMVVPSTVGESFHHAAAADILLERVEGLTMLRHAGVMALDALPGEYSAVAIGQYLDIKARNLL